MTRFAVAFAGSTVPLFGVVVPGVEEAVRSTKNKKVGVIGTSATVRSGAYERLIQEKDPKIHVFSKACPLFVPHADWSCIHSFLLTL